MIEKLIAGKKIQVNDEGYLIYPEQWDKDIAIEIAKEYGIILTDKHFAVLDFLRQKFFAGESLTIRKVGNSGILDIKEFYHLFPGGPLKIASKIAGIPKPVSCI